MGLITQWDSLNSMSWINNDTFLTAFYVVTPLILFSLLISFAKLEARLVHSAKAFHNVLWGYCAVWICLLLSAYFQLCELIHANKFYYRALGLAKICGKNAVAKRNLDNLKKKKTKRDLICHLWNLFIESPRSFSVEVFKSHPWRPTRLVCRSDWSRSQFSCKVLRLANCRHFQRRVLQNQE